MKDMLLKACSLSVLGICFFLFSCASGEEKVPTAEVQIAKKAFGLAQEIKDAFVARNQNALQSLCSRDLYNTLSSELNDFAHMDLTFKMRWVDIDEDGLIHLYISWKRKAIKAGDEIDDSGMGVFVIKEKPFLTESILRESPFD